MPEISVRNFSVDIDNDVGHVMLYALQHVTHHYSAAARRPILSAP